MIIGMGEHATLVIAITGAEIEHLQAGQAGTPHGETLTYEGAVPLGLVQNILLLYAPDKETLIRIFQDSGVDTRPNTLQGWADRVRRGERTDQPKKEH